MKAAPQLLLSYVALSLIGQGAAFSRPPAVLRSRRQHQRLKTTATAIEAESSIVCIGDVLFDCISSKPGISVDDMLEKDLWTAFPGGANANVASAYSKLGGKATFVGCVGNDEDGRALKAYLQKAKVNVDHVKTCSNDAPTRRILVTLSDEGDRSFAGFWGNRAAGAFADAFLEDDATIAFKPDDWIVCGTLSLAFPESTKAASAMVERGLQNGARLLVDVNWRPVFWDESGVTEDSIRARILNLCSKAYVIKLTDEEAEWLLGIPDAQENPSKVHAAFSNAAAVLVTSGENGVSYSGFGDTGRESAFDIKAVETTGAGDAFSAGFLHQWNSIAGNNKSEKYSMSALVLFASAVGALTCTRKGAMAAQPMLQEVEEFLMFQREVMDR